MNHSESEIFDQAVERHGGRFNRAALGPNLLRLFDLERNRALSYLSNVRTKISALPPVHFDFLDGTDLNAVATRFEGEYCIGINSGVLLTLSFLFGHAFADRNFFPHLGEVSREAPEPPTLPSLGTNVAELIKSGLSPVFPIDDVRMGYCRHFIELAFDFVVSHELAHIAHGHLDYLMAQEGVSWIAEFGGAGAGTARLKRQTLEMDADSSAAGDGVGTVLQKVMHVSNIPSPWNQFYLNPPAALFHWNVAIYCLFRLFGDSRFTKDNVAQCWYPPPRMRQFMASGAAREDVLRGRPDLEPGFCADFAKTVGIVERLFDRLFGSSRAVGGLQDVISEHGLGHMDALRICWEEELRRALSEYSHTQLPA